MIDIKIIILIFAILLFLDKGLTAINIIQVQKNFPESVKDDPYKIERNPIAKWSFKTMGLTGGTLFYYFIGLLTMLAAYYLLSIPFNNSVALYVLVILYGFVIANNFYFMFKYSGLIP